MNETETTEMTDDNNLMSPAWAFINYALNKYMPLLVVGFVGFYTLGYSTWEPYLIVGLMMFSNNYNFKCGYAHSFLESEIENNKPGDEDL
tara:strand:+ start:364 stop:633 length:270 start_codon:yes stop_codon:yes gene_type:complete